MNSSIWSPSSPRVCNSWNSLRPAQRGGGAPSTQSNHGMDGSTAIRPGLQPQAVSPVRLSDPAQQCSQQAGGLALAATAVWQEQASGGTPTSTLVARPSSGSSINSDVASDSGSSSSSIGAEAWKRQRQQWTGRGTSCRRPPQKHVLNPYASYDDILSPDGMLEQPVPLVELVEVLVDAWIDEGMYG